MNELDRLKSKIRQCDATILEALLERNKGIEEITLYKKEHGLPFFQREQEMGIQKWLKSETVGKPHKQEVEDVFFSIYKGAKKIQAEKLLDQNIFLIGFLFQSRGFLWRWSSYEGLQCGRDEKKRLYRPADSLSGNHSSKNEGRS